MMILFRTPLYTLGSVFILYIGEYIFNHILGDKFIVYTRIFKIGIKGVQKWIWHEFKISQFFSLTIRI